MNKFTFFLLIYFLLCYYLYRIEENGMGVMRKDLYEKNLASVLINFLLYVFKWLCLGFCVVNAALTIGLIIIT